MKIVFFLFLALTLSSVKAQNVGLGTASPGAPLHVKSISASEMFRVEGINPYISFFNGPDYSGYLWYNANKMELGTPTGSGEPVLIAPGRIATAYFTTAGRLGLGIAAPVEKLDVNGNINLRGNLQIDGSAGAYGQVYVTGGPSLNPQWKNLSFSNNTRFAVTFEENTGSSNATSRITLTRYNLNTTNVTIGASQITINQSGLYHFDLAVRADMFFAAAQTVYPQFSCWLFTGAPNSFPIVDAKVMMASSDSKTGWRISEKASLDVYITAPANVSVFHSFGLGGGTSYNVVGYLTGHLISE